MEKISHFRVQTFTSRPLTALPAVMLEAFLAEKGLGDADAPHPDSVEYQRTVTLWAGARERAVTCCELEGHDGQAAALLVAIDEMDAFLDGSLSKGGADGLASKLDYDELAALHLARNTMVRLLTWHFQHGAAGLLPIARHMGLIAEGPAV